MQRDDSLNRPGVFNRQTAADSDALRHGVILTTWRRLNAVAGDGTFIDRRSGEWPAQLHGPGLPGYREP